MSLLDTPMSVAAFEQAMAKKGCEVINVDVGGGGECMFRAVSVVLHGHENLHAQLRADVVQNLVIKYFKCNCNLNDWFIYL